MRIQHSIPSCLLFLLVCTEMVPQLNVPHIRNRYLAWPMWLRSVLDQLQVLGSREAYYRIVELRVDLVTHRGLMADEDYKLAHVLLRGLLRAWLGQACPLAFKCWECPVHEALKCWRYTVWGASSRYREVRLHGFLDAYIPVHYDAAAQGILGLTSVLV